MKTLSLFMSLVLFITFNASAAELMKFGTNVKKSKRVEQAKANQKKYSRDYIIQLRQAHINFLIKLENDINAGHLTSAESQKLIDRAWSILVMSNAYAAAVAALKDGDICFIGGRQSVIKGSLCALHPESKKNCPAGQLSCDPKLFGEGTCAATKSNYGGLTANCVKASESKLDQIVKGFKGDLEGIEELRETAKTFCDNWLKTKSKPYDGCTELQDRVAKIEKAETDRILAERKEVIPVLEMKPIGLSPIQVDLPAPTLDRTTLKPLGTPAPDNKDFDSGMQQNVQNAGFDGGGGIEGDLYAAGCFEGDSQLVSEGCNVEALCSDGPCLVDQYGFKSLPPVPERLNFENASSCIGFLSQPSPNDGPVSQLGSVLINDKPNVLKFKACTAAAATCVPKMMPRSEEEASALQDQYNNCVEQTNKPLVRAAVVGVQKCLAIQMAALKTTEFNPENDIVGAEIACGHNAEVELRGGDVRPGGLAFDFPSCKKFYTWYTALMVSEQVMDVTNETVKVNASNKAQQELQGEIAKGNGQSAGIDASKKVTISAAEAEERKAAFLVGKSTAITAQLATFKTANNVCKDKCCELFKKKSGQDRIISASKFFPNSGVKNVIIAKMVDAGAKAAIAGMNAKALRDQAALMAQVKEQLQFDDGTGPEGVMKFCVENPHDVRCLGPGDRRPLNATNYGSQFGGANMGLGSLGTDMGEDFAIDPSQGGSLGAAKKSVSDIGGMNKDAAAAKDIFNAPGGGGGGGGGMGGPQGGGGGGGGGGGATANRLSDDPGADSEVKKENPIEINKKTASLEGGKAYTGGSWRAGSNNKKDAVAANPFASMFGKKQGRDPANVPEIDKPASDLFAKISHRYGEVQKRKGLLEIGSEGADGGNAKDGLR